MTREARACCRLLGVAVLLSAPVAAADPQLAEASLSYERQAGAEACPDEGALRQQVALRLGYDPFRPEAANRVSVSISPRGARSRGFRARITTGDPARGRAPSRELESEGDGCDELVQSVVLAVSLTVDPLSFARAPGSTRAPSPVVPTVHSPPPPAATPEAPPAPAPAVPWVTQLSATARVGFGLVPGISVGPVAGLRIGKKSWALSAEAGAALPTASSAPTRGATVSASLLRGGIGACGLVWWISLCGRVDLGAMLGTGSGLTTSSPGTSIYADGTLAAELDVPITLGIYGIAASEVVIPITHTSLLIDTQTPAWTAPPVAGAFSLGAGYRF